MSVRGKTALRELDQPQQLPLAWEAEIRVPCSTLPTSDVWTQDAA